MTAKAQLRLEGAMDHLRIVWQTGEALLESLPFEEDPEGTRYNVLLAVQEMVTNILRHAYAGDEQRPVLVEFAADAAGMAVEVRDLGSQFNPLQVEGPIGETELPVAEGGYGIMITKIVMDDLEYERDGDWNVLRMFKSVQPTGAAVQRV